jgi:hypothetical protein
MLQTISKGLVAAITATLLSSTAFAQTGPIATACKDDIRNYSAGKKHGQGVVRGCIVAKKDKVSAAC